MKKYLKLLDIEVILLALALLSFVGGSVYRLYALNKAGIGGN